MKNSALVFVAMLAMAACASAAGVGGQKAADVNDASIQAAANFVLTSANANECHGLCAGIRQDSELTSVKVKSATAQVVAGILYRLELIMTTATNKQVAVIAAVWSRPWLQGKNGAEPATKITEITFTPLAASDASDA